MVRSLCVVVGCWLLVQSVSGLRAQDAAAKKQPVAVYILAGQSNMEGKAQNPLWEVQAIAKPTSEFFAPMRDKANEQWVTRDDVFIKFFGRHGPLTLGYGSNKRTGVEYAFGLRVGDAHDEPVLLIKTAWGGRSLRKDFRPPSVGLPADDVLQKELDQAVHNVQTRNEKNKRNDALPTMAELRGSYGKDYRAMIAEVNAAMRDCGKLFPGLAGAELKLRGFVWFQGWNDQYGGAELEYEQNMQHFIRDVRKDLDEKDLPIVIGVMGQNGLEPAKGAMLAIQKAQLAMASVPEFRGNVRAVRTDELQDEAAARLYPEWRQRRAEWNAAGSDHPYHYLGSAIWFSRIGYRMADAALELQPK